MSLIQVQRWCSVIILKCISALRDVTCFIPDADHILHKICGIPLPSCCRLLELPELRNQAKPAHKPLTWGILKKRSRNLVKLKLIDFEVFPLAWLVPFSHLEFYYMPHCMLGPGMAKVFKPIWLRSNNFRAQAEKRDSEAFTVRIDV